MCDVIGSKSVQCNGSGYCDCKGNAAGQKCDVCKPSYFKFNVENPDVCQGSLDSVYEVMSEMFTYIV